METAEEYKENGNFHYKKGEFKEAISMYTKAIELNKHNPVYHSNRAKANFQIMNFQNSLKDAQNAINIDDNNIKSWFILGKSLCEIGRIQKDIKILDTAIKRYKKAYTLCSSQDKRLYETNILNNICLTKKLKYFIEKEGYENEAKNKYEEIKHKIQNDANINEYERSKHLKSLDEFIKLDYNDISTIPEHLICPLTKKILEDPVITIYGNTFTKEALVNYIQIHRKDPIEDQPIDFLDMMPNLNMKHAVDEFLLRNPWAYEFNENDSIENIKFY